MTDMKKAMESARGLVWIGQQSQTHTFVLQADGVGIAKLNWEKASGSLATGTVDGESWTFKRIGYFSPFISIRPQGENREIARLTVNMSGIGSVQFTDGERYDWVSNFWRAEWHWRTPSGALLVQFRRDFAIDDKAGAVEIPKEHLSTIHLPLLVILGWYLIVLMGEDAAMADQR